MENNISKNPENSAKNPEISEKVVIRKQLVCGALLHWVLSPLYAPFCYWFFSGLKSVSRKQTFKK